MGIDWTQPVLPLAALLLLVGLTLGKVIAGRILPPTLPRCVDCGRRLTSDPAYRFDASGEGLCTLCWQELQNEHRRANTG